MTVTDPDGELLSTRWSKTGEARILCEKFGKRFVTQMFYNPATKAETEFVLFGQRDWSVVLPITVDGFVLAVRQYKQGCDDVVLELPAGAADSDSEGAVEVARRELLEETGYSASSLISLGKPLFMSTRNSWTRFHTFLATDCRQVQQPRDDPEEIIKQDLIPLARWVDLSRSEIVEPSAIVTTYRALPHLGLKVVQAAAR